MNIRAEYLVGKQKSNEWAGVYGYRPEEDSMSQTEMFAVVRIESEAQEKNLERIAKMLLDELQENYFSLDKEPDQILRIEMSFNKMKAKLEVILSREEEILEKGLDLEIAVGFLVQGVLYVGIVGESKIYIYRNNNLVDISGALVDANMSGFIKTGSLKIFDTDIFCLATSKAGEVSYLETGVENLNVELMQELKEIEGAAVLLFASADLEWNKDYSSKQTFEKEISPINPIIDQDFNPELEAIKDNNEEAIGTITLDNQDMTEDFASDKQSDSLDEEYYQDDLESNKLASISQKIVPFINSIKNRMALNKLKSIGGNIKSKAQEFSNDESTETEKTYIKVIKDFINLIKRLINSIVKLFKSEVLGQGMDRTNLMQSQNKIQRNRKILVVILIIAVIFIYLGIRDSQAKRSDAEQQQAAESQFSQLQNEFTLLSPQVETVKAQEQSKKDLLISRLNTIADKAQSEKSKGLLVNSYENLIEEVNQAKDNVMLIKEINSGNIQLITDIGRVHSDSNLNDIVFTNGNIFVSDSTKGVIYKIAPTVGSDPVEFAKELKNISSLTKNAAGEIIFYDSNPSTSIGKVNATSGEVHRFPFLSTAITGNIEKAAIYNGNDALYEIHQDHQQIFKREKNGSDYAGGGAIYSSSNPPNWKTDPEFSKAIDISVPYEVYVLIQGGGLRRYLAGDDNTLNFETFTNFSQNDYNTLSSATAFDVQGKYLAVAEPQNSRVLVFEIQDNETKNLKFIKQFVYRGGENTFKNVKEVAINDATGEVYVLDGTKVIKLSV